MPAKYTKTSKADSRAIAILNNLFTKDDLVRSFLDDNNTVPNHDGYLEILNANGEQMGTIFAQVKSSLRYNKDGEIKHSLGSNFLDYCRITKENAIIFIGVDRKKEKAYWIEMTPILVKSLGRGKTITLSEEKIIDGSNTDYHKHWLKLCQNRQECIDKMLITESIPETDTKEGVNPDDIDEAKNKLRNLFVSRELKYSYYYAFIDLLEPFYIGVKGEGTRATLRRLFEITADDETEFLLQMQQENLIKLIGDLCVIEDQERATQLQNEIIDKDVIDIKTINKLFN